MMQASSPKSAAPATEMTPPNAAPTAPTALQANLRRGASQFLGIGFFYIVVLVFLAIDVPNFFSISNADAILASSTTLGLATIGQTFAILSENVDLSVGGMVPLGAVIYAETLKAGSVPLAVVVTVAVGIVGGTINGLIVSYLRINPLITTLGSLSIFGGLAYVVTDGLTITTEEKSAGFWGDIAFQGIQYGVLAFLGIALLAWAVMRFTTYGRAVYAIGGNAEAAELAGIRVRAIRASVFSISGGCAALGGTILASQLLAASPNVGTDITLNSIAAVVLGGAALTGGVGTITGSVLGVFLLGTVANGLGLLQVPSFYQTIATGVILLMAVAFGRLREMHLVRQ